MGKKHGVEIAIVFHAEKVTVDGNAYNAFPQTTHDYTFYDACSGNPVLSTLSCVSSNRKKANRVVNFCLHTGFQDSISTQQGMPRSINGVSCRVACLYCNLCLVNMLVPNDRPLLND